MIKELHSSVSQDWRRKLLALCDEHDICRTCHRLLHCPHLLTCLFVACAVPHTYSVLLDRLFSKLVEPRLVRPTFVRGHPTAMSPLAKANSTNVRSAVPFYRSSMCAYHTLPDSQSLLIDLSSLLGGRRSAMPMLVRHSHPQSPNQWAHSLTIRPPRQS